MWARAAWAALVCVITELVIPHGVTAQGLMPSVVFKLNCAQRIVVSVTEPSKSVRAETIKISDFSPNIDNLGVPLERHNILRVPSAVLGSLHYRSGRNNISPKEPIFIYRKLASPAVGIHVPVNEPSHIARWQMADIPNAYMRYAMIYSDGRPEGINAETFHAKISPATARDPYRYGGEHLTNGSSVARSFAALLRCCVTRQHR